MQRRGIFNQVFCRGAATTIKVSENGSLVKIYHGNDLKIYQGDSNTIDREWIKSIFISKSLLTTSFLVRACATYKPVNFINWLFLHWTAPFSIKEVCALSLIPSFIVLFLKASLGLMQDLLYYLCGRFIDFQSFGFYGNLGHTSGFLLLFLLIASIFKNFSRNSRPFSWECAILLFFDLPYVISMRVIFV